MHGYAQPLLDSPPLVRYGLPEYVKAASPAAGANFAQPITGGYFERLITVFCRVVTDANVAARTVFVEYLDPESQRFLIAGGPVTQSASDTVDYAWQAFLGQSDWAVADTVLITLPPVLLLPTMTWQITIDGIQATDQISRVRFCRERFYTTDQPLVGPSLALA